MRMRFEWNSAKATANLRKHGVSFETATRVFADPYALFEQDRVVDDELRWQAIGVADGLVMLMVVHAVHEQNDVEAIRIISARHANHKERRRYEEEIGSI